MTIHSFFRYLMAMLVTMALISFHMVPVTAFRLPTTTRSKHVPTARTQRCPIYVGMRLDDATGTTTGGPFFATPVADPEDGRQPKSPFFLLDIGTKGGVLFWGLVLFATPLLAYSYATTHWVHDIEDQLVLGQWIGGGVAGTLCFGWVSTLLVRIVNKDMTYAKQLKDYETQVLAKRLEELDEDEQRALLEDIGDDF